MSAPIRAPEAALCPVFPVYPQIEPREGKCESRINIGLFFDGTNNNLYRDEPKNGHSNVARLYRAYSEDPKENYYRYYIPGVGTPFPEIDEKKGFFEDKTGNGFGWGGDGRILYALIQVFNSVHKSFGNAEKNLGIRDIYFSDTMTKVICKSGSLTEEQQRASHASGWHVDRANFGTRLKAIRDQVGPMIGLIKHPKTLPKPVEIMVDVFGFSRGAAEARVFVNKLFALCAGNALFAVPMQLRFLGLFDTVASVDFVNSFGGDGHHGWAQVEDLKIDARIKNWRHFVALLEARASFPSDSARDGDGYPPNGAEIAYPGSHSDIGGGYRPGEQGRGMRFDGSAWEIDDTCKFSQVPLNDMFDAAKEAMVPWMPKSARTTYNRTLSGLFDVVPSLRASMADYFAHCGVASGLPIEEMIRRHQLVYLTWRYQIRQDFAKQLGTERSPGNDDGFSGKQDLLNGNKILMAQIDRLEGKSAIERAAINSLLIPLGIAIVAAKSSEALWDSAFTAASAKQILADAKRHKEPLVREIRDFFDQYVHDSYAGFKPLGPEPHGYFHHRVVYAGNKKTMYADADRQNPMNDPDQFAVA